MLKKLPELGSVNLIFTLKTFSHGVAPNGKIVQSPAKGLRVFSNGRFSRTCKGSSFCSTIVSTSYLLWKRERVYSSRP
jgi:hypothetical protein